MATGMDFPNDRGTNVFRIEDVNHIYWAYYSWETDKRSEPLDTVPDEKTANAVGQLYHTEWLLRAHGKHVLSDQNGVWVFSLSNAEKEDVHRILTSDGFVCASFGTERSSDVAAAPKPGVSISRTGGAAKTASTTPGESGQVNVQAYGANSKAILQMQDMASHQTTTRPETAELRLQMALAIAQSLCYALCKESSYLQCGRGTCIDVHDMADAVPEHRGLSDAVGITTALSFGIDWLLSGTLLITYTHNNMAPVRRVSQLSSSGDRGSINLPIGTPILLSPSGVVSRYLGVDPTARRYPSCESTAKLKASVSAYLARIGMFVHPDSCWLRILMESSPSEEGLSEHFNLTPDSPWTIWPAPFCLCRDVAVFNEPHVLTTDQISDPLARAEAWFLSRAARLEALQDKRRKVDLEAQRVLEPDGSDGEDVLSDLEFPVAQGITPQDVSGIYPTPPDGIRSSLNDSSPNNIPGHVDRENEQDAQPVPEALNRPYSEHESGDLFDEIEMDMFTANGLTEADFSFFDEPSPTYGALQNDTDADVIVTDDEAALTGMVGTATSMILSDDLETGIESPMKAHPTSISPVAHLEEPAESSTISPGPSGNAMETESSTRFETTGYDQSPADIEDQAPCKNQIDLDDPGKEIQLTQRTSFDTVPLGGRPFDFDDKYVLKGRYGFNPDDLDQPDDLRELIIQGNKVLPQTGMANRSPSEDDTMTDNPSEDSLVQHSVPPMDGFELEKMKGPSPISSLKRKRTSYNGSCSALSPELLVSTESECLDNIAQDPCRPMPGLFSPTVGENLAIAEFGTPNPSEPHFAGKDKAFIQVAQTLADQTVSGGAISKLHDRSLTQSPAVVTDPDRYIATIVGSLAMNAGRLSKCCTLKDLASYGDQNTPHGSLEQVGLSQNQRLQKPVFPTRLSTAGIQSIFKLHPPYIRLQRTGASIDVSAPALRFWEELSLAPSYESKDVIAFCIYPVNLDIHGNIMTLFKMIGGAYQSCNLGSFAQGTCSLDHVRILPPMPTDGLNASLDSLSHMRMACEQFGKRLGEQKLQRGNTALYMINCYGPQHLPIICAGFLKLFEAYNLVVKHKHIEKPNDLVLQIIPSELIYSSEVVAMPSPSEYRKLALELYDHCGPNSSSEHKRNLQYMSAPAIRLARTIPKSIDLRLNPDSPGPILQSDNCLHVAYAWGHGDRWLTASWTDNLGVLSWNACYCFGESEGKLWQTFSDIAREIWETTCDMMRSRSVPWRLFICKDVIAHREELETWHALLMNHTKPSIISTFLRIDTDPLLEFPLHDVHINASELIPNPMMTPGGTPRSTAPSPDVGFTPTAAATQVNTPPASNNFGDGHDADARLIDITDETWGVIMSTNQYSFSPLQPGSGDSCKALASAYLIKRAGPRDEDGLVRLALEFLSGQMGHKMIMKEVLGMYAGLGLLARVRGIVDDAKGLIPLHVAAARKAHAIVNATMRYEDD